MRDGRPYRAWALAALWILTFGALTASADIMNLNLAVPNSDLAPYTGPYATVGVNRIDSRHATITFTSEPGFLFLGCGAAGVNVNATTFTIGSIDGWNTQIVNTPGPFTNAGAGSEDGFGSFNLTIQSFDGFAHSASVITFGLTNSSGTWDSPLDVLIGNDRGKLAAAHIGACKDDPCTGFAATGYAANGASVVPEPGAIALFGCGLLVVGLAIRRLK